MISLLHLTASSLNIMFSVCLYVRFQKEPRKIHLYDVKRIFRYLIETSNLGLCFKREIEYRLLGYCDMNFIGDRVEQKRTSRGCQFIGGYLVS